MVDPKREIMRKVMQLMKTTRQEMINAGVPENALRDEPEVEATDDGLIVHFLAPVTKSTRAKRKVADGIADRDE